LAEIKGQVEIDPSHFFSQPFVFMLFTSISLNVNGTVVMIYII
jgi:hypothetical protein